MFLPPPSGLKSFSVSAFCFFSFFIVCECIHEALIQRVKTGQIEIWSFPVLCTCAHTERSSLMHICCCRHVFCLCLRSVSVETQRSWQISDLILFYVCACVERCWGESVKLAGAVLCIHCHIRHKFPEQNSWAQTWPYTFKNFRCLWMSSHVPHVLSYLIPAL